MVALTIYQPWATLLVRGVKAYETRPWRPERRGQVVIHAGKRATKAGRELCAALGLDFDSFPRGVIVGVADLTDVHPAHELALEWPERILGDFSRGRFAWEFGSRIELPEPIPCSGAQQLWPVPSDIQGRIHCALNEHERRS